MQHGGPNPVSFRTYNQTLHWVTRAAIRGLAPYVGRPKSEYPAELILDEQLDFDANHPTIWIHPKQEEVGPLRERVEGQENRGWLARKNGFFRALRAWRPTHELGGLGLNTKFKLEYRLDRDNGNKYLHTVLHLSDGDDAMSPGSLPRQRRLNSEVPALTPNVASQVNRHNPNSYANRARGARNEGIPVERGIPVEQVIPVEQGIPVE